MPCTTSVLTNEGGWRLVVAVVVPDECGRTLHGDVLDEGAQTKDEETSVGVVHQLVERRHQRRVGAPGPTGGLVAADAADVGVVHGVGLVDDICDFLATKVGQLARQQL